jgi:hypothetical protein
MKFSFVDNYYNQMSDNVLPRLLFFIDRCLLRIFSTLDMETIRSSETLVEFYQITWRHIPENSTPKSIPTLGGYSLASQNRGPNSITG